MKNNKIPYRVRHKATGLYYKSGRDNLSKIGKAYITNNNCLNVNNHYDSIRLSFRNRNIIKKMEDLGYKAIRYNNDSTVHTYDIPKSEFEIEYFST